MPNKMVVNKLTHKSHPRGGVRKTNAAVVEKRSEFRRTETTEA